MITSRQAVLLGLPSLSLQKVVFVRNEFTLMNCILYLDNNGLNSDDVVSTPKYYIFRQNLIISDEKFIYKNNNPYIAYLYQKYNISSNIKS